MTAYEPAPGVPLAFGCRVRAGDVEGVWEASDSPSWDGIVMTDDGGCAPVPRGMEQHLIVLREAPPARDPWTEQPGACGIDEDGCVWQRDRSADLWDPAGNHLSRFWSEVPPLRELVVRDSGCGCRARLREEMDRAGDGYPAAAADKVANGCCIALRVLGELVPDGR